jgi:hypothetical protein
MTVANFAGTLPTATITTLNSTTGTIATLNSTTGTIPTLVATTLITTGTGTAAAPAVVPTGDTNTGIFFPAADTIALSEGGAEAMRIDSSGNVGIGTASPAMALDVNGTSRSRCISLSGLGVTGGTSAFAAGTISADTNWGMYFRPPTGSSAVGSYSFRNSADSTLMVIDPSGNVGIGTGPSSFSGKLVVNNGTNKNITNRGSIRLSGSTIQSIQDNAATDSPLEIYTGASQLQLEGNPITFYNNGERLRIDSSGNVGIGTASPASPLHVKGSSVFGTVNVQSLSTNAEASISFYDSADTDADKWVIGKNVGGLSADQFCFFKSVNLAVIDTNGNVGIGTASPSAQLELSTDSAKKPSTNTWTIASDQRLKTNITNADNDRCYEIVKQVPLKRYTWRSEVYSEGQVKDRSKLGWIAQDVEAVFPKAVGTNRFAYNQVFEDVVTPELDSDGNAVLDENGVAKTKTEKRLVSEDVIEDCKDLNSDQIYAAMYGTIQKLIEKVEFLESKVATLEAA